MYDHYNISLRRNTSNTNEPLSLDFVFTCKTHPENHSTVRSRPRMKTGDGTTSLHQDIDPCLKKQGIEQEKAMPTSITYSESAHRALIALRCAESSHPINSILDDKYWMEVEMLHPGTKIPHPMTVQCDLLHIYEHTSQYVWNNFQVIFLTHAFNVI